MKRTLLLGTAWTASAAAAVGLGFLAVSLVDASASPGTIPLSATSSPSASTDSTATPSSLQPTAQKATEAGMVYASCDSGSAQVSGAPAAGWWVDDSAEPGEVEFRDGSRKLEVHVTCVDGAPVFAVEGPRADNSGGGDDSPASSSPAGATTDAPDDSDGRDGGGHGSDDGPGDDSGPGSSGSGSDASGSDDSGSDDSGKGRGRGRGSDD